MIGKAMVSVKNRRVEKYAGKRILIVEDDFFVRDIYQKKLGDSGFVVDTAADGLEGMERLRAARPDLILLDIFMPYVDGRDMLREIRHHEEWRDIPVILLTNFSASEGVRDGFELGADEYLIKSHFTPSEVLEKICSVFEKSGKNDRLDDGSDVPGESGTKK
ncbi:MAG: response regulator [Candidatus Moranbacteria bacterium]|nr:response regulator [Candidatus Moranbacteria bacterium]